MGDAGLDECEVVGKLRAGNEERIEGRSKEVCKVHIYVQDWEGRVNQPRQPRKSVTSLGFAS